MKNLKKFLTLLTLIVLVWSDFLTSFSYALEDILENYEVIQAENIEDENVSLEDESQENLENEYNEMDEEGGLWIDIEESIEVDLDEGELEDLWVYDEESVETGLNLEITEENLWLKWQDGEVLTWNELELSKAWKTLNDKVIEKSEKYNEVNVSVLAKEWTFPEWTYVIIEPIKAKKELNEIKEQINESDFSSNISQSDEIIAFDIKFEYDLSNWSKVELQPLLWESVQVTFDYSDNKTFKNAEVDNNQTIEVYHINDKDKKGEKVEKWEEVVEKIEINQAASKEIDNALVINAESFSVYVLLLSEDNTITLTLDPRDGTIITWDNIVVDEYGTWTITSVDQDVTLPNAIRENYVFAWWYISQTTALQSFAWNWWDQYHVDSDITLYASWCSSGYVINTDKTACISAWNSKTIMDQNPSFTYGEIEISRPAWLTDADGPASIIIMDRNLWASSSWTVCDTWSNNGTCGLLYQFWNNYWFSYGTISMAEKCTERSVNLSEYSPSNPYYDSAFVYWKAKCNNAGTDTDWAAVSNFNIWWWKNGSYTERQWPCPNGWRLPTQKEWEQLIKYWTVWESDQWTWVLNNSNISAFRDYFQLPFAWGRSRSDGKISHVWAQWSYDTAQTNNWAPYILRITTTGWIVNSNTTYNQVNWYSVRCFKNLDEDGENEYYTVTFKNRNGNVLWSGEVMSGEIPVYSWQPSRPATEQTVYTFEWWYPEITPVTEDATYTAVYAESSRQYTVTLTWTPAGYGTLSSESLSKEYGAAIVISWNQLTIGWTEVILTWNEWFEFQGWTGTCGKVEKQVCDEFTVYSHPEPIEFTGGNNLIITNPGYDLFSESNHKKDFEISFDIVEQNLSSSESQAAILNVKDEDQENIWPGFVIRKSGTAGKIEISATADYWEGYQTKSYSLENLHSMKISRINSILYASINGGENQQIYDYSGFYNYFTKPIVFGSSYKNSNHLFRPAKVTLSNILIKSADNCYTWNVYIVTWDCQMTAKFKEIEEHPKVTVNHHWMNIGWSGYTIHETEYFSWNIWDEFTAIEKVYTWFTAKLNNDDTIIISGNNNSNVIDLYYDRHRWYFYFLIDPFNSAAITVSGCDNGTCWYWEDVQLTVQEDTWYIFNSWGTPTSITLPEWLDRTQKTLSFTMPEINDMQIRWSVSLTAISYTITYHLYGWEEVEHNQTEYTAWNFVIYVTDPIKTGYDFLWWTWGVVDWPKLSWPTTWLVIVVNDMWNIEVWDREYYANWTPNKYGVTGSVAEWQENMWYLSGLWNTWINLTWLYEYGSELIFIAIPELGYVFDYWVNWNEIISGTDLWDGTNQLTVVVNQILDIIAFFKPSENTPYTVEHYKQNLDQTWYEFAWSGTMYWTTNASTNATGTDYEWFTLSGNLVDYQTWINADWSTVIRLYYDRNVYTITWNNWNGSGITTTPAVYGAHPEFARDGWPQRYRADDEVQYLFIFTWWSRSGSSEIIRELTGLTTEIVTGDTTYIAQYDQTYRSFEVRYHPNEWTGNMENQTFQLYTSWALSLNNFIRTGYEFDGWLYYYADDATGFYENGQTINVEKDYVKWDRERELGLLYFDLYAQWKPSTDVKVTVNYYLKDLDADNNVLIDSKKEYATWVEFTWTADSVVESILATYGTGIEWYEYSKSIVYGPDYPDWVETWTTIVLSDGSRVIDMYYMPSIYQFILNSESHSITEWSSETSWYYYGANVRLSGDSNDDCFTWSGWTTSWITLSDNTLHQTWFAMPANDVEITPSTMENTYNIIFNGNGSNSWTMSPMNGIRCTESTWLAINTFEKSWHTFTGWSTTQWWIREYVDGATVDRLSTWADVNLYAVWDINKYNVNVSVATWDHGSLQWSWSWIYEFGETLVIIAVPELGYLFDYWEVNGSEELPEWATTWENQLTIVVNQILDIVAHFKENVWTVTVNYYEMNTWWTYSWVTDSTAFTWLIWHTGYATVNPPYGFHLDTGRTANTWIVISDNDAENVIDIYYARDKNHVIILYTWDFEWESLSFGSTVVINPILRERYYYGEHVYFEAVPNTWYAFKSWTYSGDRQETISMNQREINFDMWTGEVWLTLDGDIINYYIYYNLDWGIENPERPKNRTGYTVRDYSFEIYDPIKTGYIFLWWSGGINGTWISTPVSWLIVNVASGVWNMSYYANWMSKPYIVNVTIEPENWWTVWWTGEYHYGDPISLIATPNVDSWYQFTGWYVWYDKISDYYSYWFQADDSWWTGLIAKFELRNHYLEVIPNDWTKWYYYPEYRNCYQYWTVVPVYATPNPWYQIRWWRWSEWGDYITTWEDNHIYTWLSLDVRIIRDTSIRLEFEPEIYNVTYMDNDEVLSLTPSTYSVENHLCSDRFEGCMQILPEYSKDGYDFTGWYWNPWVSQESKVDRISSIWGVTVYAWMIPTTYRVNYHLWSWETLPWWYVDNFDEYTIESWRTYLPEPEKQWYDFLWWKDSNNHVITGYWGWMTWNIDLYPIWTGKEMNIEVRYHEMDTNWQYPREWSGIYYTGLTASTFIVPDYTHTGFSQDRANYPYQPTSIVVSWNDNANVVDVYYKRETYWLNTFWIKRLLPEIDSGVTFAEVIPDKQESGNQYYFGEEITVNLLFNDWWNFTWWYDATNEDMWFPPEEVSDLTVRNFSFHMPAHDVKIEPLMEHIPYVLSFTWYEWADVSEYYPWVEDQEIYFGYHAYLPYLNKSWYWFNWWKDEYGNYEWRTGEPYPSEPTLQRMPSHDYELIADFSPRTDMGYAEYYYLQDIEWSGYSLSWDLTTWWLDGVTEQLIPKRYPTVTGFDLPRYWIDGQDLPYDSLWPVINATWENFINYYYDRLTYLIDVDYDSSKMLITWTWEYRYDAPVVLTATVKTWYEFSGFVSENPEYNTTGSTLSFNVPYNFVSGYPPIIHAYAKPIVYSIDYEMNWGHFVPYNWAKTWYTVDWDFDLDIFDAGKEWYTFLWWTWGVIWVRELTEPTTWLIIPLWSIWNRKYFANFEATWSNVTVNYYLKKIDSENNVLTWGIDEYLMGIIYTWLTDTVVDIHALYGTGIEWYEYTTAIVYGSDFTDWLETDTTTILWDGSRVIDIYYTPKKYNFTVIQWQNSTTSWTSISTWYYFGAYVTLSGDSKDNCFEWDKWWSQTLPAWKNQQHTTFEMPAHNVTVESMVKEKSYNIIFNANGWTWTMSTLSVQCTTWTLSPNNFEKDWYTFTGWSRNSGWPVEFTGESDIHRLSTESGGTVNLYAIWDLNHYTVTFDLNGWDLTWDMTLTMGYTIETPAISLENYIPIKTGYNFSGWYKDNDLANSIAWWETWNYTLIAKWEAIPFTVSFDTASWTTVESQIYYYNDVLSGLDEALTTKTGYNFSGWYLSGELYTTESTMPAENITLTAKRTPRTWIQYQVNHRWENTWENNYTTLLSGYKMYGTSDSQTVAESWSFAGFSLSGNVNQKIIKPDGTTVVDIYYNRNIYSITLDNNWWTGVAELTWKYQAPLIVPNPSKSGYEFAGWNPELPTTIPSYNYTWMAMWNPSTWEYKVEFYYQLSDGTYPSVATSEVIRTWMTEWTWSVTAADKNPTMSGYTFDSTNTWNVLEGEIVWDGSLILKVYFKKQFTVEYLTWSQGTFPIDIHSDLDYWTWTPVFKGNTWSHNPWYTFSWWNPELKEIVTWNMTYEAQWKADLDTLYSVEYYKENLNGWYDIWTWMYTWETDTEVTALIRDFTWFTYSGWNQNNITSGVIAWDESLVLKLFYNRNKYTIIRKDGNNEVLKTDQVFYGAMPIYSWATPTKNRTAQYTYTFNDTWSPNIELVTTWVTYVAQFYATVNEYLITFKDGDWNVIQSWMVAYWTTPVYSWATPTKTATAQYTYTFNDTWSPNIESVTTWATYVAQFDATVNSYTINIVSNDTDMWTISTWEINAEYGAAIIESGNKITIWEVEIEAIPNPADAQYTYEFDKWTNSCGSELVWTCTIQANFKKTLNKYTITWKDDDGNLIDTTSVEYGKIPTHAKPTKPETEDYRYIFVWWNPELTWVIWDAEYTAVFNTEEKEKPSEWNKNNMSGWWRRWNTSKIEDSDNQNWSGEDNSDWKNLTGEVDNKIWDIDNKIWNVDAETLSLYQWARENGITTMDTLEEANPDGPLTRWHMAKMAVNFAENVLWKRIPTTYSDKCNWNDKESERESEEIKIYAKKACALWVMWIYVDEFMPNKVLDRAEFGTVVSRLLWWDKYNIIDTDHRLYYENHLQILKKNDILTQIENPEARREIRKWVWLVFRRVSEKENK